jgi:hypothetical protein
MAGRESWAVMFSSLCFLQRLPHGCWGLLNTRNESKLLESQIHSLPIRGNVIRWLLPVERNMKLGAFLDKTRNIPPIDLLLRDVLHRRSALPRHVVKHGERHHPPRVRSIERMEAVLAENLELADVGVEKEREDVVLDFGRDRGKRVGGEDVRIVEDGWEGEAGML